MLGQCASPYVLLARRQPQRTAACAAAAAQPRVPGLARNLTRHDAPFSLSGMKLTGKVALITNVRHYMGPAITEEFAREGASLALHDRDEAALKPLSAIGERLGRDVLALAGDLTRGTEADRVVQAVVTRFGRL